MLTTLKKNESYFISDNYFSLKQKYFLTRTFPPTPHHGHLPPVALRLLSIILSSFKGLNLALYK